METKSTIVQLLKDMLGKTYEKALDWVIITPILTTAFPTALIWLKRGWRDAVLVATLLVSAQTLYLVYRAQKAPKSTRNNGLDEEKLLLLDLLYAKRETDGSLNFNPTNNGNGLLLHFMPLQQGTIGKPINISGMSTWNYHAENSYTYKAIYAIKLRSSSTIIAIQATMHIVGEEIPHEDYKSIVEIGSDKTIETNQITKCTEVIQHVNKGSYPYPYLKVYIKLNDKEENTLAEDIKAGKIYLEVRLVKITILND